MMGKEGFTLIEVMIAMVVLSVGILGVAAMQTKAIDSNSDSIERTNANAVGLAFMEELKRLPFNSAMLIDGAGVNDGIGGLDDGSTIGNAFPDLVNNPPDISILDANFMNNFPVFANAYRIAGAGNGTRLVDESNKEYLLFYNVDGTPIAAGAAPTMPYYRVRLFVYWQSTLGGVRHLEYTTNKYDNLFSF